MPSRTRTLFQPMRLSKITGRQARLQYRNTHYTSSHPRERFRKPTAMIVLTYLIETPGSTEALAASNCRIASIFYLSES